MPPIAKDGSTPALCIATVAIEEVVVLPWVPATAIEIDSDIKSASAAARVISGIPKFTPASRSGLFGLMAFENTIKSAPLIWSAL